MTYITQRLECPFCKERLDNIGPPKPALLIAEASNIPPQIITALPFLEGFSQSDTWFEWFKSHRPKTLSHWVSVFGIGVGIVGIVVGLFEPAAAISRRVRKVLNHAPRVEAIECEHVVSQGQRVSLVARADDSDGDQLSFRWTSSAGRIEGNGKHVFLVTDEIIPKAISTDLMVEVVVTDQFGETAYRQERISIFSRKVLNNPPILRIPPNCDCLAAQLRVGERVSVFASAEDEDTDESLVYNWQTSSSVLEVLQVVNSPSGSTAILGTPAMSALTAPLPVMVSLRVSDRNGGDVSGNLTLLIMPRHFGVGGDPSPVAPIKPNHAPKLEAFTADKASVEVGDSVRLWAFTTDPDRDTPLYYDWRASAGEIFNKGETATFNTAGLPPGQVVITVTVSDGHGGSTSQKLFLALNPQKTNQPTSSPNPSRIQAGTEQLPVLHQ